MLNSKKKILGISGSTRLNSANESILKIIAALYVDVLDVQIYTGITTLPYFNPDLDNENVPSSVTNFRTQIQQADGVIICTPEYVFSLPGALKNALEWTVSTILFSDKPTALIVASAGGEKAYESLQLIMNTLQAKIGSNSSLLIQGARSKINSQVEFSNSDTLKEIKILMNSFLETLG